VPHWPKGVQGFPTLCDRPVRDLQFEGEIHSDIVSEDESREAAVATLDPNAPSVLFKCLLSQKYFSIPCELELKTQINDRVSFKSLSIPLNME